MHLDNGFILPQIPDYTSVSESARENVLYLRVPCHGCHVVSRLREIQTRRDKDEITVGELETGNRKRISLRGRGIIQAKNEIGMNKSSSRVQQTFYDLLIIQGDQSQSGKSIKLTFLHASCLWSEINVLFSTMFDVFCVKISLV